MKNWKIYSRKTRGVLTVYKGRTFHSFHRISEEHMADKCLAKPSLSLLLMALYSLQFLAFTGGDSITIQQQKTFPFFIEQRNILFQKDISFVVVQDDVQFVVVFLSKRPGGHVISFKNKTLSCIWVAIPADWVIFLWYACGADGRSVYGHMITKFSRMDRSPHFLSYGAPPTSGAKRRAWSSAIRKPQLISRGGGVRTPRTLPLDPPLMQFISKWRPIAFVVLVLLSSTNH